MFSLSFNLRDLRTVAVCLLFVAISLCGSSNINAQCPGTTLTGGLLGPSKLVQSNVGNLIVAETGPPFQSGQCGPAST